MYAHKPKMKMVVHSQNDATACQLNKSLGVLEWVCSPQAMTLSSWHTLLPAVRHLNDCLTGVVTAPG